MVRKQKSVASSGGVSTIQPLAPLSSQVGYVLRRAQLAVFRDFVQRMAPLQLRPSHFAILTLLEETPGLTQIQVCHILDVKRPNLVRLIDELERRDLVVRGQDPSDRRSYALRITPQGRQVLGAAQPLHDAHERWIDEHLAPFGKDALMDLSAKLAFLNPIGPGAEDSE